MDQPRADPPGGEGSRVELQNSITRSHRQVPSLILSSLKPVSVEVVGLDGIAIEDPPLQCLNSAQG